ncbi:MAG: hypothetical protein MJ231_02090, partial [bacterium]|nr:hypothetical protein [bacterium]
KIRNIIGKASIGQYILWKTNDDYSVQPTTRSYRPKYESFPKHTRNINGIEYEYRGISIDDMPDVLTEKHQGYVPGTKKEDIVVQIHGAPSRKIENIITNYNNPNYSMVLSTSIRKLTDARNGYGHTYAIFSTSRQNRVKGGNLYHKINGFGSGIYTPGFEGIKPIKGIPEAVTDYLGKLEFYERITDTEIEGIKYSKEYLQEVYQKMIHEITSVSINEVGAEDPLVIALIQDNAKTFDDVPDDVIILASKYKLPLYIEHKP